MIDLDDLFEELEACRDKGMVFLDICESISRRYGIPQDFVEA